MDNSQKFLKILSGFIETGILTSQDIKKDLSTSFKFKKEKLINNLNLATKEDLHILKKIIEKQQKEINLLKKNKKKILKRERDLN